VSGDCPASGRLRNGLSGAQFQSPAIGGKAFDGAISAPGMFCNNRFEVSVEVGKSICSGIREWEYPKYYCFVSDPPTNASELRFDAGARKACCATGSDE
jgi:hypothetical protein